MLLFDPSSPDFRADPYPTYARMRREDPVHWCPLGNGFYAVSRYEDVAALLRDPRLGMGDFGEAKDAEFRFGPAGKTVKTWMLLKDPPDHTRLRRLVSQAFTPRAVERMRPRIEQAVGDLLARPIERGSIDVVADLAFPLPVYVIAEMLGVPVADRERFHVWTQAVNLVFEAMLSEEEIERCNEGARALGEYLGTLAGERRRWPREDLLTAMIAAEEDGKRLSDAELVGNTGMLLAAGFETTMGLIANGALALCRNPAELTRLRREPALIPNAVEEFLRYDSSVQYTGRWTLEDVELHERTIPKGNLVFLLVASANRDPGRFRDPDRLDVGREDVQHLSFGGGRHFCLGAPLARLEAEVAFRALVPALRDPEITAPIEWRPSALNHVPERLPVRF